MKKLLLLCLLLFSCANSQLLLNPSFELDEDDDLIPDYWGKESFNNSFVAGREQGRALKISNNYPKYSIGNQIIKIKDATRVSISCWIKAENIVVGTQPWKNAKLQVLFYDQNGERLGEYPEVVAFSGSFDWKKVARTLTVPKQAVEMHLLPGIWDTVGTAYFDDICLDVIQEESDPFNHLLNGDLETLDNWSISSAQNIKIVYPGFQGNGALLVNCTQPEWLYAVQTIKLLPNYQKIKVSGYLKTENIVAGSRPWQLPRLYLEFKDANGNLLALPNNDQYPVVISTRKDQDWQYFEKQFLIPAQADAVYLLAGLQKAAGKVYFDQLKVNFFDQNNQMIAKIIEQPQPQNQWFALNYLQDSYAPSALDASAWIPKPAGQFGFIRAEKGHFYFENGQRARFFGVTIYGEDCFPAKEQAEKIAQRLAKHGFNLVRLHHLDAVWARPNIFGNRADTTRKLDKNSLDKLDYFIYQLKKHGVYVYLDLLVHRQFLKQDGVSDATLLREGAKVAALFDQRLIELQKEYAQQLLTHVNKYTGRRYLDDPVLVMLAIVNENSLFYLSEMDWFAKSYSDKLDYQWNLWLLKKYQNRLNLQEAWGSHQYPVKLAKQEDPKKFNVQRGKPPLKKDHIGGSLNIREIDTLKFYYYLQIVYFQQMSKFVKDLGFQGVITGSNHWLNIDADVKSNTALDFIDRHAYWNHPQFGYQLQAVVENKPMVKDPLRSLPVILGSWKVLDKPFVVSEWNSCWPSDYHQESALIMTGYALLHDYDALITFSFSGTDYPQMINNNFDIGAMPNILTQMPVLSKMFFDKKIETSQTMLIENIEDEKLFAQIKEDEIILDDPYLPLICQTVRSYQHSENVLTKTLTDWKLHFLYQKFKTPDKIWADNLDFYWDLKQDRFVVDNDWVKAFTGFCDGQKVVLNNFEVKLKNKFATVILSAVDRQNLNDSKHLLLNVSSRVVNSGMQFNQTRTQLLEYGREPILIENIHGQITIRFKKPINNAIVYALDVYGYRKQLLPVNVAGRELSFELGTGNNSLIYEIELERK